MKQSSTQGLRFRPEPERHMVLHLSVAHGFMIFLSCTQKMALLLYQHTLTPIESNLTLTYIGIPPTATILISLMLMDPLN